MTSEVVTTAGRFEVAPHRCFACGELNAVGLRLVLHVAGDTCWTETTLSPDFQGWEGITHGGIVATILDEVMGWALASADSWGFTARLTVDYRRPTPIGRTLRAEGQLVERRRRLLTTRARLLDAQTGEVLATADALYVAAPPDRKQALKDRYRFRLVPESNPMTAGEQPRIQEPPQPRIQEPPQPRIQEPPTDGDPTTTAGHMREAEAAPDQPAALDAAHLREPGR